MESFFEDEEFDLHQRQLAALLDSKRNTETTLIMDSQQGFMNLLNSQTSVELGSSQVPWCNSQSPNGSSVIRRRQWSPKEDVILIGAWLNTSKDSVVGNEQRSGTFWQRIHDYYNASPQLVGTAPREASQCKQRWSRMNDQVCKFVGAYEAASREQRSGQNDNDVMKNALDIFFNDHQFKFTLEHAWRELRHDMKWCSIFVDKDSGKEKRKEAHGGETVADQEVRPMGVKAAKAALKRKKTPKEEELGKLDGMLERKERISKNKLLSSLIMKGESLSEMELTLKLKLVAELL